MKRMKQWMGIILTIMLMVGSMQMPVYAEDMKRAAFEAVDLDNTDITETAEEESMLLSEGESSEEADIEEGTMDDSISEDRNPDDIVNEIGLEQDSISLSEEEENIEEDSATTESSYENSEEIEVSGEAEKETTIEETVSIDETEKEAGDTITSDNSRDNATQLLDADATQNDSGTIVVDGIEYLVQSGTATVTGYQGDPTNVVISEYVNACPVTAIGGQAFGGCESLESITLPKTIQRIEDGVIKLEDFIYVVYSSFGNCCNLRSVIIPEDSELTYIGRFAFYDCLQLHDITLPEGFEELRESSFDGCSSLEDLNIPSSMKVIGQNALSGTSITTLHLPSGLKTFHSINCMENLRSVDIEEGNEEYKSQDGILYAYEPVEGVYTWIVWIYPEEKLDDTYVVPDFIELFGTWNILGHYKNGEEEENYWHREYPKTIDIGKHRVSKNFRAEYSLLISDDNPYYTMINGSLYSKDGRSLICVPTNIEGQFIIPDSVTTIESYAFYRSKISSIQIPDTVVNYGDYALSHCANLEEIRFPEKVSEFGSGICNNSPSLQRVYLPKNIESLSSWAFAYCRLSSLFISESLQSIDDFCFYSCYPESIYYEGTKEQWDTINIGSYNSVLTYIQERNQIFYQHTTGHIWSTEYTIDQKPTCTQSGSKTIHCTICDVQKEHSIQSVPARGHIWNKEYTIDKEPTISENGLKSIHCSVCDARNAITEITIPSLRSQLGKTARGNMFNLANNVKVTWNEVPGAKYYKVYREGLTDKNESLDEPVIVTERLIGWDKQPGLTDGHKYRYKIVASLTGAGDSSGDCPFTYSKVMYRLKTVVIRSVKNTAPGEVTIKYDKTTSGDSYVLQYSESKDMKNAKTKVVLGANNTSYVLKGLKKGKTYYISIRVRKKVKGIDYYTTFGVAKQIKITK